MDVWWFALRLSPTHHHPPSEPTPYFPPQSASASHRLIGVMEHLCAVAHPAELGKWFPLLLKQLYDEDLVDEDVRTCVHVFVVC